MTGKERESFCPASRQEWRAWLKENHQTKQSVWLVYYKKKSGLSVMSWPEAVEEALCFGWIDSVRRSVDDEKFIQLFSRRKLKSVWSKINKEKVQSLMDRRLMTQAGYESVEAAKQNGSWTLLDDAETLKIPDDLEAEFKLRPGSGDYFMSLSKSARKAILQWLVLARQQVTRKKRIIMIAESAAKQLKPEQFR